MLAVLVVAALYRFGSLGHFPPLDGFSSIEETQRATGAYEILEHGARPWEWPLPQYLAAMSFALFGYSMHALRIPATVLGCSGVLAFYLFARQIVRAPAALFATFLLAVSRWHVQVSWYNEDVYTPLSPFVLLLYLLLRIQRQPRPSTVVASGALAGYALYDYAAFRVAPLLALPLAARGTASSPARFGPWERVALCAGVIALFALPLFWLLEGSGRAYYFEALWRSLANTDYYTADPTAFARQRIERIALAADAFTVSDHFAVLPSLNSRAAPLLAPLTAVLFVLGLGTTALRWRERHHGFLALAFLALAAGAAVVVQNFDFRRLAILIPFAFAFVAVLAEKFLRAGEEVGRRKLVEVALGAVALAAAAHNYHFLFRVLAVDPVTRSQHRDEYTVPAFYLRAHYRGEYAVLVHPLVQNFFSPNDYEWLKPRGLEGRCVAAVEDLFPLRPAPPEGKEVLVLIERPFDISAVAERLRGSYPGAACSLRRDPDGASVRDLGVCRIPASSVSSAGSKTPPALPGKSP